jgi:hypothetical protein
MNPFRGRGRGCRPGPRDLDPDAAGGVLLAEALALLRQVRPGGRLREGLAAEGHPARVTPRREEQAGLPG